jgi:hypothetical protein
MYSGAKMAANDTNYDTLLDNGTMADDNCT